MGLSPSQYIPLLIKSEKPCKSVKSATGLQPMTFALLFWVLMLLCLLSMVWGGWPLTKASAPNLLLFILLLLLGWRVFGAPVHG